MSAPVAACAPGRRRRRSQSLGRDTCLTEEEESKAAARRIIGSNGRPASDRELSKKLNIPDLVRPRMPKEWRSDPRMWLSDLDIDSAMRQYERLVPDFVYLGTMPVDFSEKTRSGACVRVCSSKPFRAVTKNNKLGATVINLDVHTGKGSHWVALALDCRARGEPPKLMYYDSTGSRPPDRWLRAESGKSPYAHILAAIPKRSHRMYVAKNASYNRKCHQRQNTECGMFAMMFVDALISGKTFSQHCSRSLTDKDAFENRSKFFEPLNADDGRGSGVSWSDLIGLG